MRRNSDDIDYYYGQNAISYRKYRPTYPKALYEYLSTLTKDHNIAWDAGTGSGQAAINLAKFYKQVIATDISQGQISSAIKQKNIIYQCTPSEKTTLSANSVDLITVAEALHWFDLEKFYQEVKRVGTKYSVIAAWFYGNTQVSPAIDTLMKRFINDILCNYWPIETMYIKTENYQNIPFPFKKINTPNYRIEKTMNLQQFIGYLHTISAIRRYMHEKNKDPVEIIYPELNSLWNDSTNLQKVLWPLSLLVGYIH